MAESALPLRCFSGPRRRGPVASSSSAQLTLRARGCSYPEAVKRPRAARPLPHVKQIGPGSPARARFLLRPFGPPGPSEAPLLGGAVTGRAGAEGPVRWPPLGPRIRDPRPAAGKCFWLSVRLGPGTGIPLQGGRGWRIALLG